METKGFSNLNGNVKTLSEESPLALDNKGKPFLEEYDYASVVGMLLYLVNTQPDIQYAVHSCCCFVHCPRKSHADTIKQICRYLVSTKDKGLTFSMDCQCLQLYCFVDVDFAGLHKYENHNDLISSKSRTGYVITLGRSPISWCSKLQTDTAMSTTESEIIALSSAMRELIWVKRLIVDISEGFGINVDKITNINATVHEDNQAAITNDTKCIIINRTCHIHAKYW